MMPAAKRSWFRFGLASCLIFVAISVVCTHWFLCVRRASIATARVDEVIEMYSAGTVLTADVLMAFQQSLDADLAVPMRSQLAAYETHMRRLGKMRALVEGEFPATGMVRPIVEFTSHYELARRQLAKIAGEEYANAVDSEFDFPFRDQIDGHPAAERGL